MSKGCKGEAVDTAADGDRDRPNAVEDRLSPFGDRRTLVLPPGVVFDHCACSAC